MSKSNRYFAFTYRFRVVKVPVQQALEREHTQESVYLGRSRLFLEALVNESGAIGPQVALNVKRPKSRMAMSVNPMFEKLNFWEIVDNHSGRIAKVEFFIPPANLARTSKNVTKVIQDIEKSVSANGATLRISAAKSESLSLSESDERLQSLVNAPKDGTPPPRLKPVDSNRWEKVTAGQRF